MKADTAKKIQVVLLLAFVAAAIRLAMVVYERHEANKEPQKVEEKPLDPDYYVSPPKFYGYDVKSAAAELTKAPVWVKVGYAYHYYRVDPKTRHADLKQDAGWLLPLEKLQITDVVAQKSSGEQDVLALFAKDGATYATSIGTNTGGDYQFLVNDMFFLKDPHQLYSFWPNDVWAAIDRHEAQKNMSQLQVGMALGAGYKVPGAGDNVREYPAGGHPIRVVYEEGKAHDILPQAQTPGQ